MVVQNTSEGEVNWIIETKGRKCEGTEEKCTAMAEWCSRIAERIGAPRRYKRIDQIDFNKRRAATLAELVEDEKGLL